jgi:hypothetical protein
MPRYQVMIDDNFHRYDESERTKHGVYDTWRRHSQRVAELSTNRLKELTCLE